MSIFLSNLLVFYIAQSYDEPSIDPKGIRLTSNSLNDSVCITWYTDDKASDPKLEYSYNEKLSDSRKREPDVVSNISGTYVYSVNLRKLSPDTTYYYQVSSDSDHKSKILSFRTLPNEIRSLKFLVIADFHQNEKRRQIRKEIYELLAEETFEFFIHCGDMVSEGGDQSQWNRLFREFEAVNSRKVGLYIEGNHDIMGRTDLMYRNLPLSMNINNFQSVKFGDYAYFLGLNTEDYIDSNLVMSELNRSSNIEWKFSFMHRPVFNTRIGRESLDPMWHEIFKQYNLDIVFSGHNHIYERNYINGSNYISVPTLAGRLNHITSFEFTNNTLCYKLIRGYLSVEIENDILTMNAYGYNEKSGNVFKFDNLTIIKRDIDYN